MNESTILAGVFGALGVAVLMATVSKNSRVRDGLTIIEYGNVLKIFGLLSLLLPIFLGAFAVPRTKPDELNLACIALLITSAMSITMILEFFMIKITYDGKYIHTKSPWREPRSILVDDILSVNFSELASWHILRTKNQGCIRVHTGLNGHGNFVSMIKAIIHKRNNQ